MITKILDTTWRVPELEFEKISVSKTFSDYLISKLLYKKIHWLKR